MKILFLVARFLPKHFGGSELVTYDLAQALMQQHQVRVAYAEELVGVDPGKPAELAHSSEQGIAVSRIVYPYSKEPAVVYNLINRAVLPAFNQLLDEFQPDIIHVQHLGRLSAGVLWEAAKRDIPLLATLHDFWFLCGRYHLVTVGGSLCDGPRGGVECALRGCYLSLSDTFDPFPPVEPKTAPAAPQPAAAQACPLTCALKRLLPARVKRSLRALLQGEAANGATPPAPAAPAKGPLPDEPEVFAHYRTWLARETLRLFSLLISPSEFLRSRYIQYGVAPERIVRVPNSVSQSRFLGFCREKSSRLRFGYIGSSDVKKGIHDLIFALNRLAPEEAELVIAGPSDDAYAQKLRAHAAHPGIRFMGKLAANAVRGFYENIDVMVLPSLCYENAPLSILEAFYTKTPVIAVRAGGMAELVREGENGLLYRRGEPEDLLAKLRAFTGDPGLVGRLARRAPEVWSTAAYAEKMVELYQALLSQGDSC